MSRTNLLEKINLSKACSLLRESKVTSLELVEHCYNLAHFGDNELKLNAYTYIEKWENLRKQANASDDRIRKGCALSPLDGIPISMKANMAFKGWPFHASSKILGCGESSISENVLISGYDSDIVKLLVRKYGAIMIGQTNMDEFAMGSFGFHSSQLPTRNPLYTENDDVVAAGGSSSGGAAAVAHGSSLASIGTDTGGSVRLPAAWCKVTGLKPTYGLISRHGVISYASSLDTIGIIAQNPSCASIVLDHLAHPSITDSTSISNDFSMPYNEKKSYSSCTSDSIAGLRIGLAEALSVEECPALVTSDWQQAADCLELLGADIVMITNDIIKSQTIEHSLAAYYIIACAEASSNLMRYDGLRYGMKYLEGDKGQGLSDGRSPLEMQYSRVRSKYLGNEVKSRIMGGTAALSGDNVHIYYEAASKLRANLSREFNEAFKAHCDVLLLPTVISSPPKLCDSISSIEMTGNDIMTVPFSLAGLPSIAVPCKGGNSFQIVAAKGQERTILKIASMIHESTKSDSVILP